MFLCFFHIPLFASFIYLHKCTLCICKKNGIFLCSWKFMDHHWYRNHDPVNIALNSLMQVAHFFFLYGASTLHYLYISFMIDISVIIAEWYSCGLIQNVILPNLGFPLIVETQLLCKPWRPFSLLMAQTSLPWQFVGRKIGKEADIIADILNKDMNCINLSLFLAPPFSMLFIFLDQEPNC